MSNKQDKLTKKLQVLLTEDEVHLVNRIILNEAIESESRPISVSAFIRDLIQREIKQRTPQQMSITRENIKNLKSK